MQLDLGGLRDDDLLRRVVAGSHDAFAVLVRRHEDRVFSLAYRMMGNRADALEASQEIFLAVFRQAASFRGDAAFSTWLYRVGTNACRDLLRKKKRDPIAQGDAREEASPTLVDDAVVARVDVSRALASLPDAYREAVVMHDLGGIPYEDIARLTGARIGTVKSRISRGRRLLGEILEQPAAATASKEET